jgi:DNA-binding transcriptional ArsR family regulator
MLDRTFASLADPTRRAIIERLTREREVSVGDLAVPFKSSVPAVIKHIDVLEGAGLIVRRKQGRHVCISLVGDPMAEARAWLDRNLTFWSASIDKLQKLVDGAGE